MGYVPDEVVERLRTSSMLGVFVRMDTDPPLRMWFGVNDVPAKMLTFDSDPYPYLGGGRLANIENFELPINGTAERVNYTLSGIDPESLAKAMDVMPVVRGKSFSIGITVLDEYYQPVSEIIPLATGKASTLMERSEPATGTSPFVVSLGLSVGFGDVTRSRKSAAAWSHAQQRMLYPGDDFCKNTPRQARGTSVTWPRF